MDIHNAAVLWIESDPVSGGSQSQVEFPIELGPFFGGIELAFPIRDFSKYACGLPDDTP
jgi:hypothetical protein